MKLQQNMPAPEFSAVDVSGNKINLSDFRGRKVLLTFYRNAGCPICNLRFHGIQQEAHLFEKENLVILSVYESDAAHIKQFIEGENFYSLMIPDPTFILYNLYRVERSMSKMLKALFKGAFSKAQEGNKLYKKKIEQDGNTDRIGADFLLDEHGKIIRAYYGKYVGDHLPVAEIKRLLTSTVGISI